jgi:hypothetical protein
LPVGDLRSKFSSLDRIHRILSELPTREPFRKVLTNCINTNPAVIELYRDADGSVPASRSLFAVHHRLHRAPAHRAGCGVHGATGSGRVVSPPGGAAIDRKTSDQSGDGTTTTTVLAQAVVQEGAKNWSPVPASQSDHNQMRGLPNLQRTVNGVATDTIFRAFSRGIAHFSRGGWCVGTNLDTDLDGCCCRASCVRNRHRSPSHHTRE